MKLKSLNGLRGLAALIVVITHCQQFFFAYSPTTLRALFEGVATPFSLIGVAFFEAFYDGSFAIMVFWVLSGVVLSIKYFELILEDKQTHINHYLFFSALKRYFRLLAPVLLSVIIGYLLLQNDLLFTEEMAQRYSGEYAQWLNTFFPFNADFMHALRSAFVDTFVNYSRSTSYNPVLWTMEKEFIGSLLLFASLAIFGQHSKRQAIYIVLLIALILTKFSWLAAFVCGILICDYYLQYRNKGSNFVGNGFSEPVAKIVRSVQHIPVLIILFLVLIILIGLPNYKGLINLLLASFLIVLALISLPVNNFLSSKPLQWLGKISFGLYLSHFLLVSSFSSFVYLQVIDDWGYTISAIVVSSMTVLLSLVTGLIFYYLGDLQGIRLASMIVKSLSEKSVINKKI